MSAKMSGNAAQSRNGKTDRRVLRSRDALHRAMIALVLERGYEAVTISDIVARANVGRSTFYTHYQSKEDLLTTEMHDLRALLTARQKAALNASRDREERMLGFSLALFEHAVGYRDVYRVLIGERGVAIVNNRMRALLADLVRQDLAAVMGDTAVPRSALVQFVVGALMSVLSWWIDRRSNLPPAEVDAIFRRLTIPAIAAAVGEAAPKRR